MRFFDWRCRTCGEDDGYNQVRGECHACYSYRRRHGITRPAYLFGAAERTCENCAFPVKPRQGRRCRACAQYEWIHGCPRPERLWDPRGGLLEATA